MESKSRQFIESFNPKLERLDSATNVELSLFYAGSGFDSFSKYIQVDEWTNRSEAMNDIAQGRGVTHLIYNYKSDGTRDIVAYFTLSNNVIPYDDGIEDDRSDLSNYPSIPVAEIKMFAVSELYQDVFYRLDDMEMPIAAWCLHFVIAYITMLCDECISFQAIFLHSLETAEVFYKNNHFCELPSQTKPLYSVDGDLKAMWLILKKINLPEK